MTYTEVATSEGERVGVCLFGSLDNLADWAGAKDDFPAGWSSSAWYAIADLLRSRGVVKESQWDDDEQLDTRLTPGRWADLPANVDRILTGALMWVRTGPESVTLYSKLRRELGTTLF
ncbi:hypothetical protein [Actinoplanes sp. NPDC048796]|uniref:hypothetical protein n=1 Tax=unclassified Actinoplanes TaxID=2626549 RepID=UPI0033C0D3FB